jgi:DNA-directed RNA polymerase specialized sigma24 family protein
MSPEKKRDFESEWPLLAKRLKSFLARKNVPVTKQDDLIQETALRLYKMWDTVDRNRPAWALTVTIALNLVRDEYRKAPHADVVAELPDIPQNYDVERAGLARVEIGRVRQALAEMSPAHRLVLLAEVGHTSGVVDAGAAKMRRMRARRKLTEILERVSAIFVLPARRLVDVAQAMIGAREGLMAGVSCMLCTVLGIGVAVTVPLGTSTADASTLFGDGTGDRAAIVVGTILATSDAATSSGSITDTPTVTKPTRSGRGSGADEDADNGSTIPSLPLPSDPAPEPPTVPLPNRGPQGGPNIPEPPPLPTLPGQRNPNGVPNEVARLLASLAD